MSVPSRLCLLVLRIYLLTFANALSCVWAFIQTISNVQVFVEQTSRAFLFFLRLVTLLAASPECQGYGAMDASPSEIVMWSWSYERGSLYPLSLAWLTVHYWPSFFDQSEKNMLSFRNFYFKKKKNSTNHGTSLDQWIASSCQVFPSTLWTPGINLRLSDLKKSTFTHWLICVASSFLSDSNSTTWSENLTGWGQYVSCRGGQPTRPLTAKSSLGLFTSQSCLRGLGQMPLL